MTKRKKGIIITSTCALLAGAAVIAELALGGGTPFYRPALRSRLRARGSWRSAR